MENRSNKTIVTEFYKQVIGQRDLSLIDNFISDHYIQHSPMGRDGKAGIMDMLQFLKSMPAPVHAKSPVTMAIADGDFVALQLDINLFGKRKLVVDLFRIEDGKLAEHWDAVQDIPADTVNELMPSISEANHAEANKQLVTDFFNEVFVQKHFEAADNYLAAGYQHADPHGLKFKGRLIGLLKRSCKDYELKVYRVIGEGVLVLVQSCYSDKEGKFAVYDIFQVDGDKIISQWSVEQGIPDKMLHDNGML